MKYTFNVELPVQIGDKIWMDMSKEFGHCNFLERYKNLQEVEIDDIKVEHLVATGKTEIWLHYKGGDNFFRMGRYALTKEEYYENWRKELEDLIPEDLRNYLWK